MDKEKLPKEYVEWIEAEKTLSEAAYQEYLNSKPELHVNRHSSLVSRKTGSKVFRNSLTRIVAAAVVVIVVGISILINKDRIFNPAPKYTKEQIALSYEHAIKALTAYSSSLNKGFDKLQSLPKITKDDHKQ